MSLISTRQERRKAWTGVMISIYTACYPPDKKKHLTCEVQWQSNCKRGKTLFHVLTPDASFCLNAWAKDFGRSFKHRLIVWVLFGPLILTHFSVNFIANTFEYSMQMTVPLDIDIKGSIRTCDFIWDRAEKHCWVFFGIFI